MFKLIFVTLFALLGFGTSAAQAAEEKVNLQVLYIPEAPDGLMVKPWNNSCEEASTAMLDEFYFGNHEKTVTKAKSQ